MYAPKMLVFVMCIAMICCPANGALAAWSFTLWLIVGLACGLGVWGLGRARGWMPASAAFGVRLAAVAVAARSAVDIYIYTIPPEFWVAGHPPLDAYPDPGFQLLLGAHQWGCVVAFVAGWLFVGYACWAEHKTQGQRWVG
jgi:hypothetical protein